MTLRQIVQESREQLVSSVDTVCLDRLQLVTEVYREASDLPPTLLRAKAFSYVLDNMTLDLDSNPVFAGNTSSKPRAWMLLPEYSFSVPGQALVENPSLEGLLDGDVIPRDYREFWKEKSAGGGGGIGHLAIDNVRLLSEGLSGIIQRAEAIRGNPHSAANVFAEACVITCHAMIRWAHRYADEAERLAEETSDAFRKGVLLRVSKACRRVPEFGARDFFESLQSLALVHLAIHIEGHGYSVSSGRLDQDLLPYFFDETDAPELLDAFLLKLASNSVWGSHSKTQAITLGGSDPQGKDASNVLTMKFLESAERMRIPDPHIFIRWHDTLSSEVKEKSLDMLGSHCGMPMFIGDASTVRGLLDSGVAPEDAWNYCIVGCNELGIPGKMIYDSVNINGLRILRDCLADGSMSNSMDELVDEMEARLTDDLLKKVSHRERCRQKNREKIPTPFTSSLMEGCLEKGQDLTTGVFYPIPVVTERGFTNLVNALTAIEKRVFDEETFSLEEFTEAMLADFEGFESVRQSITECPRWGTDAERPEYWAHRWLQIRDNVLRKIEAETGSCKHLTAHVVRSLHHVDGRSLWATPDGRLAGTPIADSVGVQQGTFSEPPEIAYRVARMKAWEHWTGGYNFNLSLPGRMAKTEADLDAVMRLIDVFFSSGGQELQLNFLDAEMLRKALENPQEYADLLFRVAGFCGRFTSLSEEQQQELIDRAESVSVFRMRS